MANKIYHEEPLQHLHPVIIYSIHLQIIFRARTATAFIFVPLFTSRQLLLFVWDLDFEKRACQPPALLSIDNQTRCLKACHTHPPFDNSFVATYQKQKSVSS